MDCRITLQFAVLLALGAAMLAALGRHPGLAAKLLFLASVSVGLHLGRRLLTEFPYFPMYAGAEQVAALLGPTYMATNWRNRNSTRRGATFVSASMCLLVLAILFFPKDYYLTNPKTGTPWAHAFFWGDAWARTLFLTGAGEAIGRYTFSESTSHAHTMPLAIPIGVATLALSLASGTHWSLMGLGVPIAFHQKDVLGVMLVWFYWMFALHLRPPQALPSMRAVSAMAGGILVLVLTIYQNLGVWRPPCLG